MVGSKGDLFAARLTHVNGNKLEKFSITNQAQADEIVQKVNSENFTCCRRKKTAKEESICPFYYIFFATRSIKTSVLALKKQSGSQKLYEGIDIGGETLGLITYMRQNGGFTIIPFGR